MSNNNQNLQLDRVEMVINLSWSPGVDPTELFHILLKNSDDLDTRPNASA
jgi:hypothetical protein